MYMYMYNVKGIVIVRYFFDVHVHVVLNVFWFSYQNDCACLTVHDILSCIHFCYCYHISILYMSISVHNLL